MASIYDLKVSDLKKIKEQSIKNRIDNHVDTVSGDEIIDNLFNKGCNGGGYNEELWKAVEEFKPHYKNVLYLEVVPALNEGMNKLYVPQFDLTIFSRSCCPTPSINHSVYRYTYEDDELEELWVLPDTITALEMRYFPIESRIDSPDMFKYYLDYKDGTLLKLAKRLNDEKETNDRRILVLQDLKNAS